MTPALDEDLSQDPTDPAQWLLDRAAQIFVDGGTWPLFSDLKRELARRRAKLPVQALITLQELGLTEMGTVSNDEVVLNVGGLARSSSGRAILASYVEVIELCVEKYLGTSAVEISTSDLVAHAYQPSLIQRIDQILLRESYLFVGRRESNEGWIYAITNHIDDFRVITNIRELLEVRAGFVKAPNELFSRPRIAIAGIDTPEFELPQVSSTSAIGFDVDSLHPEIAAAARELIQTSDRDAAVFAASKALFGLIRRKTGFTTDGTPLVEAAFQRLVFGDLTTQMGRNLQRGTLNLATGIILSIRNQVAHRTNTMDFSDAMEALATISLVARRIDGATLSNAIDGEPIDDGTP